MNNYYRHAPVHAPVPNQSRFFPFFGAPLVGGFVGGLIGSAILRPRPFVGPYGRPPIPPYGGGYGGGYGGYGGYGTGGYGRPRPPYGYY